MDGNAFLCRPDTPFIDRLSDEILSEIFLYCCRTSPSEPLLSTDAPLNASGVAARWRRVALTSPRLWSCISFRTSDHPDDTNNKHFIRSLECCKAWIERSGAVPLRLWVTSFSYIKPVNILTHDVLRNQRHRFVEAHLFLNFGHLVRNSDASVLSLASLPKLESLTVAHMPTLRERALTIDLSHSQSLREVTLHGNIHIAAIRSSLTALKRFTYAKLNDVSVVCKPTLSDALRVFCNAPDLEEAYLQGSYAYGNMWLDTQRIRAGCLRKLSLILDKSVDPGTIYILDQLTLPALEDAEFNFQRTSNRGLQPTRHSILSLFQRSEPPLKRLSVGGGCIDDLDLLAILHLSPTLRCLELMCHVFADLRRFLDEMTLRPDSTTNLCLELDTIVFYACPWGASGQGMADMILSRFSDYYSDDGSAFTGKLRKVCLYRTGYLHLWQDEAMQDCVQEGLDLDIS